MQAWKYQVVVGAGGEITLPRLSLPQGTPVEIIILVPETETESQASIKRGQAIFETRIKAHLEYEDPNDFLAIDTVSGDYEINSDDVAVSERLRSRQPDAVIYVRRVGDEAAHTIGGGFQE